ncbi:MAG TPA: hypothetical protein VN665_03930 [Candidatus Paceibacterota bacterium]|nr:hypothetical protein [Candidatus Paceibacterota bacterium]
MNELLTLKDDSELEKIFPKKEKPPELPLPIKFDQTCKNAHCEVEMERMHCHYYVTPAPFATFQCPKCMLRLFLFEAPHTPLLMWSDTPRKSGQIFKDQVKALIERREKHWETNKRRHGEDM